MNRLVRQGVLLCVVLLCSVFSVSAEVRTSSAEEAIGVTVAGNPNFYPIEYYDEEQKCFAGVMPRLLQQVSEHTGIHFTYVLDPDRSQTELANAGAVDVVSSYVIGSRESFETDAIKAFSFADNDKNINIGLAFTQAADEHQVLAIKQSVASITPTEMNGFFVDSAELPQNNFGKQAFGALFGCLLLLILILLLIRRLEKTKKELDINRITDEETGIGNLAFFEQRFQQILEEGKRKAYYIVYIIIDHNALQFQQGESALESAIAYVAEEMKGHTNENEFSARITESGFAWAFESTSVEAAEDKIQRIVERLNAIAGGEERMAPPVFHAAFYNLVEDDFNCGLLLFNLRRNCNRILGSEQALVLCDAQAMNSALEEKKLMEDVERGLKEREFILYLQFIVDNKTKKIVSAEALSRWQNPQKGLLLPGRYIGALESAGKISELDYYMFEQVCRLLHKWRDTELENVSISCNFTRMTLSDEQFADRISNLSARYVFDHQKLILEITEDTMELNRDRVMDNVFACKNLGFRVALDDLGSGYTSLVNLCDYPVDIVKLDRDILLKAEKALVSGIVALAHSLDKKVVCEGVENEEQEQVIFDTDCDYIQGWYYSKPLPVTESELFYRQYNPVGGEG